MVELLLHLWLTPAISAVDQHYLPAVDQAQWQISGDQFRCRMSQSLGNIATLNFQQQPGGQIELLLQLDAAHLELQDVQGQVVAAGWQPDTLAPALRFSPSEIYPKHASFDAQVPVLLQQLQQGFWLQLTLDMPGQTLQLQVPNLQFEQAMQQFQLCISKLLPMRWEQARDAEILFAKGATLPDSHTLAWLSQLASYIKQDRKIRKVLLDGHSDDAATSLANRLLSEQRADDIASRLIELGVPKAKIEIRAHGNRYPQVQPLPATKSNRRVVIRLIRTPA